MRSSLGSQYFSQQPGGPAQNSNSGGNGGRGKIGNVGGGNGVDDDWACIEESCWQWSKTTKRSVCSSRSYFTVSPVRLSK